MTRCGKCGMLDTRPGSIFEGGVCQACTNYAKRSTVNWAERMVELAGICRTYKSNPDIKYNCLIPVSGGKDSYTLVNIMVEDMGMRPLLVTVTDSFTHTKAGTHNLRNLIERYKLNHWQYTINHDLFKRATRAAFEEKGEPLKFVEYAIYTIPYILAQQFAIPLVVYGENSAYEYGSSTRDSPDANIAIDEMVRKMGMERPFWTSHGVSDAELDSILPNPKGRKPQVIYMSYYQPWSSVTNLAIAKERGFRDLTGEWDRKGTCENFEQIDSMAYMVHLWMKYPKFGFQRAADIASRRLREGTMTLAEVKKIMAEVDPVLDPLALDDFCTTLGYSPKKFYEIAKKFDTMGVLDG
jgi:N-acetyl sugar amidotransferase